MKKIIYISLLLFIFTNYSCNKEEVADTDGFKTKSNIVFDAKTDKTMYELGENVSISFSINNPSSSATLEIKEVSLFVKNLTDKVNPLHEIAKSGIVAENLVVNAGESLSLDISDFITISNSIDINTSCGIYTQFTFEDGTTESSFATYFRVVDDNTLHTYNIDVDDYNGLPIYKLTGGMSSEFGVEKSLTSFAKGISHSWFPKDNNGPFPVWASVDFLELSLQKTVDLYNAVLGGENVKVKTVILGTGVPSVPYISTTMHAAYLPVHFLASVNSVAEVEAILDYAEREVGESYATLGYDGSMPEPAVAWIKLLELPEIYRKFIEDHDVEEVILWGVEDNVLGETWARKVIREKQTSEYGTGSIYIQYTGHGSESDLLNLKSRINDFDNIVLEAETNIPDWESGLSDNQISKLVKDINNNTDATTYSVTAFGDMIHIYDIASYLSLEYLKKNESVLGTATIEAVTLNEYLTSNPQFEITLGRIPLLYWQFIPAQFTIDRIFNGYLAGAISSYYPEVTIPVLKQKIFYLNSNYGRNELKTSLINYGVTGEITARQTSHDVWTGNGSSFSEVYAWVIINLIGLDEYQSKQYQTLPLTINELESICSKVGSFSQGLHFKQY
ncbi:MAG: hypothetical protein PHV53_01755 [Fermentimonas sp.]|nr:hypothetical protein [Fermentimonas sp.]